MDKIINIITHHISYYKEVTKLFLFGSRARGDHKERSDYDFAILGKISDDTRAEITHYLYNGVPTLHKIDFVFIDELDTNNIFHQNIEKEGIVLYDRK